MQVAERVAARCLRASAPRLPPRALPAAMPRPLAPAARRRALHCAPRASANGDGDASPSPPPPWGIGFSAAGLLFPYYVGVGETLQRRGILTDTTPMAGASAGSLIAAALASGRSTSEILDALKFLTADLRQRGTRGRLRPVLEGVLRDLLPEDAADRARGRVHVAVTRITPPSRLWPLPRPRDVVRGELVTDFRDRDDFIDALLASCYIPFYFDSVRPGMLYRGGWCTDGGISQFLPVPPNAARLVRVTCFPDLEGTGIAGGAIDIAPAGSGAGPASASGEGASGTAKAAAAAPSYGIARLLQWALTPASDEVMDALMRQGASDAERWALKAAPRPDDTPAPVASARGNGA